jgi:hypothetical protein
VKDVPAKAGLRSGLSLTRLQAATAAAWDSESKAIGGGEAFTSQVAAAMRRTNLREENIVCVEMANEIKETRI